MIDIPKNRREVIRIRKREWRGQHLLDVRIFYPGPDGKLKPSGKGVSVSLDCAGDLAAAIVEVAGGPVDAE